LRHHFRAPARDLWRVANVRWEPYSRLVASAEPGIAVPIDLTASAEPRDPWQVPFNGTSLTPWNRIPRPVGWTAWPSENLPLWYDNGAARFMPAWDVFGNVLGLLDLTEELESPARDPHGRFLGAMSPRRRLGLLEVPAFNEAAAVLIALARLARGKSPEEAARLDDVLQPVGVVLSHDLDLLRGDDLVTQSIRIGRFAKSLARLSPDSMPLRALIDNWRQPHRYYLDAIPAIVELERLAGARSSFYFLNGTGGRFGARSGSNDIPAARARIPADCNVGMHYNYDTLLDRDRFEAQRGELERLLGERLLGGRAHYLRFDSRSSFDFLAARGLLYDETLGYPDRIGFRAGIAGAYHPVSSRGGAHALVEIPLAVMADTLHEQYASAEHAVMSCLFEHLSRIGGTLSFLLHPETLGNPENEHDFGYQDLLRLAREHGARFLLPNDFVAEP
jgi:hypothetical protein